jgi:hypothetical protein
MRCPGGAHIFWISTQPTPLQDLGGKSLPSTESAGRNTMAAMLVEWADAANEISTMVAGTVDNAQTTLLSTKLGSRVKKG